MMVLCNVSEPGQYYFQNGGTLNVLELMYLNDYVQFYLLLMIVIIGYIYVFIYRTYIEKNVVMSLRDSDHGSTIEIIWTVIPALILMVIAIPSFKTLYNLDSVINSKITVKCVGSQWYWTYQYNDTTFGTTLQYSIDSYMVGLNSLELGQLRLLTTDNNLILPVNTSIRLVVTSSDVIHSFSVPSLGVKVDAVPGRLNQTSIEVFKTGMYYGACQEICGIQHAFMPIVIEITDYDKFITHSINNFIEY